jgi:F-box/leucine-rich repeat protein 2/20
VKCICFRSLPVYNAAQSALLEIASWCPNVKVLDIRYGYACGYLPWDCCLHAFAQSFQGLTHLSLCGSQYSSEGLASALTQCKRLENVEIRTGYASIPVEVAIPTLKAITLYGPHTTDDVLVAIGQNCRKVETLDVFATSEEEGCKLTDVGVRAVLQGCPLLRKTDVHNARGISTELRVELAKRCNLTKLYIGNWWDANDELARGVLKVCPNLSVLDCTNCEWLTDATLAVCAQHCPLLETVVLNGCPLVTDEGVLALVGSRGAKLRVI